MLDELRGNDGSNTLMTVATDNVRNLPAKGSTVYRVGELISRLADGKLARLADKASNGLVGK